jgi:hypothetical protein
LVKMIVASAKDPKTRKRLYPVFWDSEYLDLPILEKRKQKHPAFDGETVTGSAVPRGTSRWIMSWRPPQA